jgi:hypothetical protein
MNDTKKSAIAKLAKMGLTEEEVLSLFMEHEVEVMGKKYIEEETIIAEDGESSEGESKSWQQLVMEEHVGYYNKRYGTSLNFDEYYEGVTTGKIEVHYNWKQMLGLEEQPTIPLSPEVNTEKFKKNGN